MSHKHVATETEARAIAGGVGIDVDQRPPFVPGFPYEVCGGTGGHGPHIWHHAGTVADPLRHVFWWDHYEAVLEDPRMATPYPGLLELAHEWARQRDAGIIDVAGIRAAEDRRRNAELDAWLAANPERRR